MMYGGRTAVMLLSMPPRAMLILLQSVSAAREDYCALLYVGSPPESRVFLSHGCISYARDSCFQHLRLTNACACWIVPRALGRR